MNDKFLQFIQQYLGEKQVGDTPENEGECVGLVSKWADLLGAPHDWGNAKDLLDNADKNFYEVILNTPDNFPQTGDIIVYDYHYGDGNGHTAVVIAGNLYHIATLDQNWPEGNGVEVVNHDYTYCSGWLRKK